jgi:glycosyltransferase involved in cell wall biosynthesis
VQSARHQTLQDIEIILVDDESPDSCPQMCDEYAKKDSRIKVVHKKNGGLGFARNSGLEVATGEYVTFLDSDDFVDLYTYENLYNYAIKNNADVIYYKLNRFYNDEDIKITKRVENSYVINENNVQALMLDVIASDISVQAEHKINCSACTGVYKLSIIRQNNVSFHSERELISEDLIFNLDFLKHCKNVVFDDNEYYHYRLNPKSLTNTIRLDRIDKNLELFNYIIKHLADWGLEKDKGEERASRMFIGYSRSFMNPILKSSIPLKDKIDWLNKILAYPIWDTLGNKFNWKRLPLYARIHFFAVKNKLKTLLILIAYIR